MLTLAFVGGLGYEEMTRQLQRRVIQQEAVYQRAQAEALEAVSENRRSGGAAVEKLIDVAAQRPGAQETLLIDSSFKVVDAGNDDHLIGRPDKDRRIIAALRRSVAYAGREADPTRNSRDFEFITPVDLPGGRFAFEASYSHKFFDHELNNIRRSIAIIAVLGLLGGGAVFYLFGGRSLMRSHRRALARARLDGLTDLPNQRAFHDEFDHATAIAVRHGEWLSLAIFDLDDFKFVNDRHGHRYGDELLLEVAARLRAGRAGDRAFRVGGDRFAVLLPRTDIEGGRTALDRVQRGLAESRISVSVGLSALGPGQDAAMLRDEADAALSEAKRRGRNTLVLYEDVRDTVTITTREKVKALRRLLAEGDVEVAFQPIWNLDSGALVGVEALARPSDEYGFSGPAEAFDVAEQIGRVRELDMMCVEKALNHATDLPGDALLFINISPRTLDLDAESESWLVEAVERSGVPCDRVVIEVTERFGGRMASISTSLQRLRAAGLKLALDDVGAGNSGLEMLREVDVEFVKLDRSIVTGAMTESKARAVMLAMTTFANETGSFVIAEGIEDRQMLDFIRQVVNDATGARFRIHGAQGYGLGRADSSMPTATTNAMLGRVAELR